MRSSRSPRSMDFSYVAMAWYREWYIHSLACRKVGVRSHSSNPRQRVGRDSNATATRFSADAAPHLLPSPPRLQRRTTRLNGCVDSDHLADGQWFTPSLTMVLEWLHSRGTEARGRQSH